jgi:SEL1 protein
VEQNLAQALKYYEMAANAALIANNNNPLSVDYDSNPFLTNHPEAAGWAATFHLLGIGTDDGEPNYEKAWKYMQMGAPGGLKTCSQEEDRHVCDAEALNCFGLAYVRGLPGILEPDPARAAQYFALAKEYGSADGQYNLAMMRLGWMNLEEDEVQADDTENIKVDTLLRKDELVPSSARLTVTKPSKADYSMSFNDLMRSANKGHIQSLHKAGLMYARGIGVQQHCPSAVKFLRQVSEQSPAVGQRIRRAHKAYREGNIDLALWNYLVVAEAGVELAQSNAAWLLERGHCLGLDQLRCAYASVRMWKAASKQGNSDANIRVGDFHYYGRLVPKERKEEYPDVTNFDWPFLATYIARPNHLVRFLKLKMISGIRILLRKTKKLKRSIATRSITMESDQRHTCSDGDNTKCSEVPEKKKDKELGKNDPKHRETNFKLAAQYYRKAADAQSGRANFNLGFMYEWGLGLDQDFPLAKRHYDLAATHHPQAELAVSIALWFMHLHEKFLGLSKKWVPKVKLFQQQVLSFIEIVKFPRDRDSYTDREQRKRQILMSHIFSLDMLIVVLLTLLMMILISRYMMSSN